MDDYILILMLLIYLSLTLMPPSTYYYPNSLIPQNSLNIYFYTKTSIPMSMITL